MTTAEVYDDLSEREIEILHLLNDGLSNKEIAHKTGLTLYTVKWYLKQVYSKLYVNNRTQAATRARELGLLENETTTPKKPTVLSNLPETLTPFFGREEELRQLTDWLNDDSIRLMTIHGAGGMGKTRLALELAQRQQSDFSDGVFFVPLAGAKIDPLTVIFNTLQLPGFSTDNLLSELSAFLKQKHCLLVLDNFEQLISYGSQITALLERTQYLQIVVTSREVLRVRSEVILPLEGLTTQRGTSGIENSGAYQLYLQRAQAGDAEFNPSEADKARIGDICELLGGMPLAIEIAAGWVMLLSVDETYKRLQSSLDLLTSDEQDRPERQQSIRATFDYSWDLLPSEAQNVLLALGVFDASGFSLDAAEKIAGASPLVLKQLLDTALIQRLGQQRFVFHPLIHQYVTERLEADGEFYQNVRAKHGLYFYNFVMGHIEKFRQELNLDSIKPFLHEMLNLDVAWKFALERGNYDWLETAVEVGYLCEFVSLWRETDFLFATTMKYTPPSHQILHGRLLAFRAIFAFRFYDLETMRAYATQSWEILKDTPYAWDAGAAMAFLALGESFMGNDRIWIDLLAKVDDLLERDDLEPHASAQGMISSARLACLFFSGFGQEALPILQALNMPSWHEVNLHLSEFYFQMDMMDKARESLESLYNAALDNHYYKSAVYATFYLELLESRPENLVYNISQSLLELVRISGHYAIIAKLAYYYGTLLMIREHQRWAKLLFMGNLLMLHQLGEKPLMYQYTLQTADNLLRYETDSPNQLLNLLVAEADCPPEIQQEAIMRLSRLPELKHQTPDGEFLDLLSDALVEL